MKSKPPFKSVKEAKGIAPVGITEDIWFYPCPKNFEFVVWTDAGLVRSGVAYCLYIQHLP